MTSTNDGKDVKSNQTSGHKGKTYYIELYKSLEARLSGPGSLPARTAHLCDAWRRVYSLHQHSAHSTHPHLLSWLQRHTALVVLQTEWRDPKSKDEHAQLGAAIDALIAEATAGAAARPGPLSWEQLLLQRAHWFRGVLANPWGHPVLERLLNPTGEPVTDEQVLEWLTMERGIVFVTRLRTLAAARDCSDLALTLASTVMERARAARAPAEPPDTGEAEDLGPFAATLTQDAGFSQDVWDLLVDIEFVLLHKRDKRAKCIDLAKQTPLRNGYQLVERLRSRPETSPRDKKLWKDAKEVATLIAQVIIARCMVVPLCGGASRSALYCCARALARLLAPARLPAATAALAAPAATARHLHTLCSAMHAQCSEDMMPFVCELYVRAITAGMNELERLKDENKQSEARQAEQTLASWFTQLGALLGGSARLKAECALTAFSVHPAHAMFERVRAAPPLAPPADTLDLKPEGSSEFNSWANDSRSQSNLVKTSETLQLKQAPRQANVLSTAILTEGEALGLSVELGQDLVVLLAGPRVKTLLWDMDRELLLENCRVYMERTHAGTRALTTELKYLNLDPRAFQHLPEEEDDENDAYYGIEKGYEHLVQLEEPEEIWQNAFIDPELTESAAESEVESYKFPIKKKNRSLASSDEEDDPLSIISDAKKEKKRANREKSKEHRKKKTHKRDSSKDASKERRKDKDKKPKKERKKNKSDQPAPGSLTSLLGMKVTEMPSQVQDGEKRVRKKKERRRNDVSSRVSVTDSDYDSQGKLSQVSDTNEPNILIGGLSVDELKTDVQKSDGSQEVLDSTAVRIVSVLKNPSITKAKKPAKITKAPSVKTASDDSDTSRARSPYLTPNQLANRHVVSSKVRNSITKLLQFRRNKLKAPSVPKSQTPVQQSTSARTQSLIGMKIHNPEGPKIHMTQKQCQELEAFKNEVNHLLNVADPNKPRQFPPKIPYNEPKEADKFSSQQSVYNAEKHQDMRYIQHNSTQNVLQNSSTFRESQNELSDYMPNTHQTQSLYNNYVTNQPPRPTSVIDSYISPPKQFDRQYTPHISPPKTPVNRIAAQPFHKSMQNLANNADFKNEDSKKHLSDSYYYNQFTVTNPQTPLRTQNNACIQSPNVAQSQAPNFKSYSSQQQTAVMKAREDVIKFYNSVPDDYSRINQSRGPHVNTQVSQSLNNEVLRHGQKHMSNLMQDTRNEKLEANDVAKRPQTQTPNDTRPVHASYTKTYASPHAGESSSQLNFNASDNKLQSQLGRIVQNPVKPSSVVRDPTPKQLNVNKAQQQAPKLGIDNNFHEFLKELQKSINAGVNATANRSVALNKEVKVSLVNTPLASVKKNDLTPPSAKQLIPQKKTENAPNTFSRLSYMHKNKQNESKLKNDPAALKLELNKNILEHKISKAKYMKNEVSISRVDKKNTIVNDNVNMQTFPKTEQSSYVQNDFPVLTSMLDSKPLETCKRSSQASSTVTHPTSDNSVNREHADLLLLLRNQQTFIAPKAKTNLSLFDLGPGSRTQPKVEKPQVPVAANRTYQRTNEKGLATPYLTVPKNNADSEEPEDNQQDWKSVMNALRAHTTTPLGPNALEMVLKKERKHSHSSSSSQTSGAKTVSSNRPQIKASDSKRREYHSRTSTSSRKPPIERHDEAPKTPHQNEVIKKTPELSKKTEAPNKHFTSNLPKQNDPFISGIPNSDYDLLEELMDDDLRQEIGELSSDEEYRALALPTKVKAHCGTSKTNTSACTKPADVPKEEPRVVDPKTILSNNAPDLKMLETNCTRTDVNSSSQASHPHVITHHPAVSSALNLPESRPTVLCSNANYQHTASNQNELHHYIANIPSTRTEPTNLIITSVPTQPMVLIRQELVYDPYPTIQIRENQVNVGQCNITQNSYVAVNTTPNIAVYQTTQFAAPVINPIIIGNAMTTTTNVTDALPKGNQHSIHEEKTASMNKTNPLVDDKIKLDSDVTIEKSINLDLTLNKNNERKVLSQVQEHHTNDVSDRTLRLSVDRNPVKTKQEEERLQMKRQSLINREVKHPRHPPIPLSYTPLGKKVNVNKLLHGTPKNGTVKSNYDMISKIVDKKDALAKNVESPKSETNNENIETPDQKSSAKENNKVCRRILLRSSNVLKNKLTPSKNLRIPLRRTKIKLKVAELAVKVAGSSELQKINDKTSKDTTTRKRISKRLIDKKIKDETTRKNKTSSVDASQNQDISIKNDDSKEISGLKLIDFENELSGSKILKAPTHNAQPNFVINKETNAETPTVIEKTLQENNKKSESLDTIKATPIQNTAVPTVLIEKLKDNLGEKLTIKSTSAIKQSEQPSDITIKNKNESILSINTKEHSKLISDKSDNTMVKTAVETKTNCKPPAVPALVIKLNSSGPIIINENKLKIKTRPFDPVVTDENKVNIKTNRHRPVVIDDSKLNVTTTHLEPVVVDGQKLKANLTDPVIFCDNKLKTKTKPESASAVDDNKIKSRLKKSEPVVIAEDKVNAKTKPNESELVEGDKIRTHEKQSEPNIIDVSKVLVPSATQFKPDIVLDDELKGANKQYVPVVVDDNKLKETENQCSPDLVDDNKLKAENNRDKKWAPVTIVKNNQSIVNNKSSKEETSKLSKNVENTDSTKILPTKETSKNKSESVPLTEITCDKAVRTVAPMVQNNDNRCFIMMNENSSLTEQKSTDVLSTKDNISIVNDHGEVKKVGLNQTPIVSDLANNSKSVNEWLLCHEKNDVSKNYNNKQHNQKITGNQKDNSNDGQSNVAQFGKEDYVIEEIPIAHNDDPNKKCVRIKLPNGKVFKATVFGKNHIDYDTLFADPAMKTVLTQSLSEGKRYTLNIKQVSTTPKNNPNKLLGTRIHGIDVIEKKKDDTPIDTVNLISDDEDDDTRSFSTEFGKYNTKIDMATFNKHQNKFVQKCVVKLSRDNIFKANRTKPKAIYPSTVSSLLTRTKSKLLSQEQNKRPVVVDIPPSITMENATSANLESIGQTNNKQSTDVLLTTNTKLLSNDKNLNCIVPDIQPSLNSTTKENLPAVIFKANEQPKGQTLAKPVTLQPTVFNNSEVIEIDESSNDSTETSIKEKVEPVKKIIELKSLLLQDFGVAVNQNVPLKENTVIPDNILAVENFKNALLKDFGVAETKQKVLTVTEQKEAPKEDSIKKTVSLMKKCLVRISKCDDLIKKYELIKRAKECYVLLRRCDNVPVKANLKSESSKELESDEITADYGEDFIDFDVEEDSISPKLSRCPSLSILNLWDDTISQTTTESKYGRSSPVMEIFDVLASLYNKNINDDILEKKVDFLPVTCCSEWVMTKAKYRNQEMSGFAQQQDTKVDKIKNTYNCSPKLDEENAVFIFKAPKLVTIALKCLDNPEVVYRLQVACDARRKSLKSPNKLKRKTESSGDKVANKVPKLETLVLNAINSYDEDVFGKKIATSKEISIKLAVTQNLINVTIGSSEFITASYKYTEEIKLKQQNTPSEEIGHNSQANALSLSSLKHKPSTNSTENRDEYTDKLASQDTLETKLSKPACFGQNLLRGASNDSNISLYIAANKDEAENEIVTKESEECSKTDNYEIQIQPEKTIKDSDITQLTRENCSKTYSNLECKLDSNDASLIHEHIEKTDDAFCEINIGSVDRASLLQTQLISRDEYSLASKTVNVPSTFMTNPFAEADPIENTDTDTEIKNTVEDIINCLLQRCEEIVNAVCQSADKQKGIIVNDTNKHQSHEIAFNVLKDVTTNSTDDSKLAIIKDNVVEFGNLFKDECTNRVQFEGNGNIIQEMSIKKDQPDDSTVLVRQSLKKGDSELLELEFKQAIATIHSYKPETEEKIDKNISTLNPISANAQLCEISADDVPKEGCEVEIVDTSCEDDTDIIQNTSEVISCELTADDDGSPVASPLVVDNKEILFNYHDYTKPPKIKEILIVNNEERDNNCKHEENCQVLTNDDTFSDANSSICDPIPKCNSHKIKAGVKVDKEEPSGSDDMHEIVASSHVKAKPELKYEFIQDDDWLTVITTENENNTTVSDTDVTSSNIDVSKEDSEIVSPVSTEGSGVTLKGIEYEDPIMGKCYVFTLNESGSSTSNVSSDNLEVFQESDSSQDANEFKEPYLYEDLHDIEFRVIIPKVTYSKGSLKRKKNMRDLHVLESKYRKNNERDRRITEKRYRKGKNIDCPNHTSKTITDSGYAKEFNRLLGYYSSLDFSLSRPFPREYLDTSDMISNWPVSGTYTEIPTNAADENLFDDLQRTPSYQPDPATQTLAEEITYQYEKTDVLQDNQSNEAFDTNFNMGFGEGSGRVIQNLKKGGVSNISAATLSDVKQSQPFLLSEDHNDYKTIKTNTDDQLKKIRQYVNFIELRDKVRSFFKKTNVELKSDWIQQNKTKQNDKPVRDFPFDLCSLEYIRPAPSEVVVQVVQVGQLPVSAAAQNPVTCDPRVTQVSDASPSQCSVDNSPNDDSQSEIKTEYTELTTADLTLPLVQEYAHQNQAMNQDSHDVNDIEITEQTISLEMEIKAEERPEIKQEMPDCEERSNSGDNTDLHTYTNTTPEHVEYSFENNTEKSDGNNAAEKNSSETFAQQRQHNGTSEKTDQIAHAMNAAGITTTPESINNSRAHALVNILSQKIRQGSVNNTQATTNTYSKTTSINAMSLQQALAQILPPPLNQTGSSENNQTGSTPVGPQVLHIVQGKNASGNQITLVDNSQQSVISNPNATQVLHIVQNKGTTSGQTSNGTLTSQSNSFSGLSLVDTGLQQGGNQLLHIVNTGNQKNASPGQLLKRVNLLTNLANVQGSNEQKMVQFVCKSADGKAIQLNAPHQRSMVLRLQPIETPNVQTPPAKPVESQDLSPSPTSSTSNKESASQQEIKSRSIYEENYAKFIQNSSSKTPSIEKSTSLPKFNQAFGKPVFQEGNQKQGEAASSNTHVQPASTNNETTECHATDNAINLEHISQISSPPLLLRKQPAVTSQSQSNLVQQIKQTISPMNIQTMHGGVIYTRQIPVNIGGGQTINLITVPSTELINEDTPKQQTANQGEIEPSIIKIVPQSQTVANSEGSQEDNNSHMNSSSENAQNPQPQPVLTQMRIKLPMLSKAPQMVPGARVVRPSFFQIQRNVIGGANQPVYQQLVLTAAPPLGQQTIRLPQAQASRPIKVASESQSSSSESQMSSSTLEQLREFDMVLEQVKERSTVQPSSNTNNNSFKLHTNSSDATDGTGSSNCSNESTQQQVLYSIGNNQSLNVAYVNRKASVTTPTTSTYVRSPDSTGIADSPTSSTHVQIPHTVTTDSSPTETSQPKPAKVGSKSKSRPKSSSNPPNTLKLNSSSVPPKTSSQKPLEDEQTTQRILYILAEYKEQVENSPDKDKPAPRRRSNPPSNPGSSKRKKSSSSRRSGTRDMSPVHGEDTCRTMGSEDSSCGTSQGDCTESCLDSHSPQDSPRKVARKITFDQELPAQARPQPQRNVIVADGQTITVARGTTGKPATAVLMPANYILPVSMVKGGQQIAIVTNRGPKLLTVGGEGGAANALLLQRLIGPGGLKPVLARPGVRHVRLPTAALHNLQAFNLATGAAASVQPPDSTASPTPGPTPPELVDTRATSSPWTDRDEVKPERGSSPEGSEPWNLPSSADPHEYSYEETVRTDNMDRTVLVVQKKDGTQRQHRLSHVSAAALRHKYAILEHELRLQKSLSEECEDLGVDSPSASELFPEAELLFAASPAHDHNQEQHHSHTPQPLQSTIPQPDMDDQIATDHLIPREIDVSLGLSDVGIVAVSEDGMQATIALDQEEFARSHPNTTFHSEPTDAEVQPFTITGLKGRHITSTIFHSNSAPATVLMAAPQATVISQAPESVKYEIENMINMPSSHNNDVNLSSVLVKDDGLTRFDNILTDSRELHLTNTTSAIVHSSGNATQVIRRVCYEDDKRERDTRFLIDEPDNLIAGDDAKMIAEDSSRDATLESMADVDDDRSSPERHAELFWESNSASERSESRRPLDFSSDSDKCCKSPSFDETNSTDSSGVGTHMRLDSVIKEARGRERSGSADGSSADDTHPPLRTYPPKRLYHPMEGEAERSLSGKTRAGERSPDSLEVEVRRRASGRGVVKRGCHCCNGSPAPPRPKKPRQRKPTLDFNSTN